MGYPIEYPPPDPDGRPHIWHEFNMGRVPEADLGRHAGSVGDIERYQIELGEGSEVVLYDDDGDEWMLVDATVDRFNPEGHPGGSWIVRLDWSTFRRMPKAAR
jgi:streptogramin lyase